MATPQKPSRLGRGLSSLMARPVQVTPGSPSTPPAAEQPAAAAAAAPAATATLAPPEPAATSALPDGLTSIPVTQVRPNPNQPRQHFDPAALQRLADSIKADGLMQPIIVRPASPGGSARFEIVAGERRWRSAQLAGLTHVPAIVRQLDDRQIAEWALIENLQREDLNALERAEAFQRLVDQFRLGHEQIAQRLGIDRSSVSNSLRLLNLDDYVKQLVRTGKLSGGQARALVALTDPAQQRLFAKKAADHDWSVRQVEQAVRHATGATAQAAQGPALPASNPRSAHFTDLQEQIGRQLQTKVHIKAGRRKGSGALTIEFHSVDQFEALMTRLGVETGEA